MNDLDARARAERLAAALGLTVRTNGNDRHGHSVSFHRGAERVDGCASPNAVDAWCDAERKLRALARAELPDAAASAAGSARYGAGLRAAVEHDVAKAARALDAARERLRVAVAEDIAARATLAAARESLPDDRARAILDALAALDTTETTTR